MHGLVPYLCAIFFFSVVRGRWRVVFVVRVWWCFVLSLFLVLSLSLCVFFLLFPARTSRLAPMARTLLGVLGQATLKCFIVATHLSWFSVCVLSFATLQTAARIFLRGFRGRKKRFFNLLLLVFFSCCDCARHQSSSNNESYPALEYHLKVGGRW